MYSQENRLNGYLRNVAVVCLFVFIGSLMIHGLYSINQDIGRHIKIGEIIWQTKSVPNTNLFSFTAPNYPFINHHWLGEVMFYGLNNLIGLKGLIVFKTILNILSFLIIYLAIRKRIALSWVFLSFFIGVLIFTERTDVRPEIFSYFYLSVFLFAILRSKYDKIDHWLWYLPIVQILWVNSHIYFALGPGILFLYLIDRLAHDRQNKAILKRLGVVFGLVCAATLVNPNFISGALEPLRIMSDYGYSIVENQGIRFLTNYGLLKFSISLFDLSVVVLAVSFFIALKNGARKITFEFLIALVFTILGFKMIRNLGPYAFIFMTVCSQNFGYIKNQMPEQAKRILYLLAIVFFILITYSVITGGFYSAINSDKKFGLEIPTGADNALKFIRDNNIKGPMFNNFDLGSFLIWKMYPEERVFVDGRPEAYGKDFFDKIYKPMQEDSKVWIRLSEEYKINYVFFDHRDITPWAKTFLTRISQDKKWRIAYIDEYAVIFVKR